MASFPRWARSNSVPVQGLRVPHRRASELFVPVADRERRLQQPRVPVHLFRSVHAVGERVRFAPKLFGLKLRRIEWFHGEIQSRETTYVAPETIYLPLCFCRDPLLSILLGEVIIRQPPPPRGLRSARRRCSRRGTCLRARGSRARRRRRSPRLRRPHRRRAAARRPACSTREDRSVSSPPSVLRVSTESFTAISGPAAGSRILMRLGDANQLVAEIAARRADRHHLRILAELVVDLAVARDDLALQLGRIDQIDRRQAGSCPATSSGSVLRITKSTPRSMKRLTGSGAPCRCGRAPV